MEGGSSGDECSMERPILALDQESCHLWLGNLPLKPNKQAIELLFSQVRKGSCLSYEKAVIE